MTLMPNPEPEDAKAMAEVVKVLLASIGGGAGFAAAGPVGAALAAAGAQGANAVVDSLRDRWMNRSSSNARRAVHAAIDRTGLAEAELVAALTRDPEVMLVAATALNAAAETAVDEKIALMARVLANAATDTALVDDELLVVRAMRVLEAPHIRALALIKEPSPHDEGPSAVLRWTPAMISARLDWPSRSVTSVLLTLQSVAAALLTTNSVDGGGATWQDLMRVREPVQLGDMACEITDFGAYLIDRLHEANVSDAEPKSETESPPPRLPDLG
jgi:hypothetical protein